MEPNQRPAPTSLPVVDLALDDDAAAAAIDRAAQSVGFVAITNHGVDDGVIDDCWQAARSFFELPLEAKLAARHPSDPTHPYGYFPMGREALARSTGQDEATDDGPVFDLKETFNLGPGYQGEDPTGRFGQIDRIWPELDGVAGTQGAFFRSSWSAYFGAMEALSVRLMGLFAIALGRPPGFFAEPHQGHLSALRAAHYPSVDTPARPGQLRAGAHSDYGTLTVLVPGEGDAGLEIAQADGNWLPVAPMEGCLVVNLGDLMAIWSGRRWPSTLHRVAAPTVGEGARMALAYFCQPAWSALIEPTDGSAPFHFGTWLQTKFDRASTG